MSCLIHVLLLSQVDWQLTDTGVVNVFIYPMLDVRKRWNTDTVAVKYGFYSYVIQSILYQFAKEITADILSFWLFILQNMHFLITIVIQMSCVILHLLDCDYNKIFCPYLIITIQPFDNFGQCCYI